MAELMQTDKGKFLYRALMVLCWLAMIIFACHASTHMVGAGDTWVAMACGRHFLNHGVDTVEPFSANSHKAGPTEEEIETWPGWAQWITKKVGLKTVRYWHPTGWVNQNWLTHVIFYWLTHESPFADADTLSFNTLVYWKFAIYIITVICVYYMGRILGAHPPLAAAFACFAMFIGRSFFDIRPAGFSNLLVAVFMLILILTTYRNILYIWLIVPVIVFWCNVHGGYLYAFIMLVPFVALNLVTSISKKRFVSIGLKGVYHTVAAGFVAFIAMLIFNPFHLTNLTHTFEVSVSEHAEGWRTVNEWHPAFEWTNPVGTSFPFLVLYILSMGMLAFWLFSRFLKPKFLRAPRNELEAQRRRFTKLSKIFIWAAAIFICWVTFISFSFLNWTLPGPDGRIGTDDDILDIASLFICAVFVVILLLSIYKSTHFIYLFVPLTLLAMWSAHAKLGYAGRYFYPFVLLPAYVVTHILFSLLSKTIKIKPENIIFPAITAVVALLLMVAIFNPFKFGSLFVVDSKSYQPDLDNGIISAKLRQTFEKNKLPLSEKAAVSVEKPGSKWLITDEAKKYSVRKEAQRLNIYKFGSPVWRMGKIFHLRRIWKPPYEGRYPLGYIHLFSVLYFLNVASVIIWLAFPYLRTVLRRPPTRLDKESEADVYQLPKIDLALITIAALTIYMAVRSRRFIPIAAIATCPVLAVFIDQIVRTISAACSFHGLLSFNASQNQTSRKQNRLVIPPMPYILQAFFTLIALALVVGLGMAWTLKFKRVYLNPWPTDPVLSSAFMRMTASDAKPFWALKFINDNKLEGKMFNYWTEGGFIGYGQDPDPKTGKTRLQLFMDGRAQAAYMYRVYTRWSDIMFGGPHVQSIKFRKAAFTPDDYRKVGRWLDEQLTKYKVWVVLMPANQFDTPFVRSLSSHPDWRTIFYNNKQKVFVDIKTPQARKLFGGIFNGETVYPDEFSRNLIMAQESFAKRQGEKGLAYALKAFELNRSQAPIHKIVYDARRYRELIPRINKFCKDYVDEFDKNKYDWVKKDGYHHRIVAVLIATDYLQKLAGRQAKLAKQQGNIELAEQHTKLAQEFAAKHREYRKERNELIKTKRW